MYTTNQLIAVALGSAAIAVLVIGFFYERELLKLSRVNRALKESHLDRTYDWLSARAEAAVERDLHWSFSDQLDKHIGNGVSDADLAPLFDAELMLGNND
jgi:hypothetical protein